MKKSRAATVLKAHRAKHNARPVSPVIKSGRNSFRLTDFSFKVQVKKKGRVQWKTLQPTIISHPARRVRIKRGPNRGKLRRISGRKSYSSRLGLPSRHSGVVAIYYKGRKLKTFKIRRHAKSLTPKGVKKQLQGGGDHVPTINGVQARPTRDLYQVWDPLLGILPQAAWWLENPGVFFNSPGDLRRVRSKYRVWFIVELPPETVAKESFKMYSQTPTTLESVFYLTYFVIQIDKNTTLAASEIIRRGPLFSARAEETLEKHNEFDADRPWLSVRAFAGIEALG